MAKKVDIFSSEGFLKLLASQMTSQNPLEPMKDTEFIGQMAQFSQLEQTTDDGPEHEGARHERPALPGRRR